MNDDIVMWAAHVLVQCKTCEVWFWYHKVGHGRLRRYCLLHQIAIHTDADKAKPIPCKVCGRQFIALGGKTTTGNKHVQMRVCNACKVEARAEAKVARRRTCQHCDKDFLVERRDLKPRYCSRRCWDAVRRQQQRTCLICGVAFFPSRKETRHGKLIVCCSPACAGKRRKQSGPWADATDKERHMARNEIRRARAKGVGWERVGVRAIIKRDGLWCHVCRKPIDSEDKTWERRLSLDHLVPVSQGGSHARRNLRLAHLGCNVGRGKVAYAQPVLL